MARRRGVAMLLVIIALTLATTLSAAYLASRDNSAVIGENVAAAAASRWASMSGVEYGITILQTESDWRTDHVDGKLVDDLPVGASTLDLDLLDMVTEKEPDETTEYVRLISTAETDGVRSVTMAEAYVPVEYGEVATVDLSDFAVFAADAMTVDDTGMVARWSTAPESDLAPRIAVGTRSTSASAISIASNAALVDTSVYYGPGASEYLVSNSSATPIQEVVLLDQIPLPEPQAMPVSSAESATEAYAPGASEVLIGDARYTNAEIPTAAGLVTLQGPMTFVSEEDLRLRPDTTLLVAGDVTMVIFDELLLDPASAIELAPDATLTLFINGNLTVVDGYIGDQRVDPNVRDTSGNAAYMDPERIRITGDVASKTWTLASNSLIKGSIYLPQSTQLITDTSAIYGRITAQSIAIEQDGALYYDPALDDGNGFATLESPIYNADGTMRAAYLSLSTLDSADLATLAGAENIKIKANGTSVGIAPADPPMPPAGEPTPRPIPVEWWLVSSGADSSEWEEKGSQYVAPTDPLDTDSRTLSTTISSTPITQFSGLTAIIQGSRRTELANLCTSAADAIDACEYDIASSYLQTVIERTDGLISLADYMILGATRTAINSEATRIKTLLDAR